MISLIINNNFVVNNDRKKTLECNIEGCSQFCFPTYVLVSFASCDFWITRSFKKSTFSVRFQKVVQTFFPFTDTIAIDIYVCCRYVSYHTWYSISAFKWVGKCFKISGMKCIPFGCYPFDQEKPRGTLIKYSTNKTLNFLLHCAQIFFSHGCLQRSYCYL